MGLFKVSTKKDLVQESSGRSFIGESGIYNVTIKFASVATAKSGAQSVNFNIEYKSNEQTIYGPYIVGKDGSSLESGLKIINRLAIIAGLGEGDEPQIETETHKVGKDKEAKEFAVITDFSDLNVKIRLQESYSEYNGEIKKSLKVRSFYREDGADASEIINSTEIGVQLGKDEAYAKNVTYENGLTKEEVEEWKKAKASGFNTNKNTPKADVKKPGGVVFG